MYMYTYIALAVNKIYHTLFLTIISFYCYMYIYAYIALAVNLVTINTVCSRKNDYTNATHYFN